MFSLEGKVAFITGCGSQAMGCDVANAALFLASDAAKYITGILVDGGLCAAVRG